MLTAKNTHLFFSQIGVVAATSFGDVVKQCSHIQNPRLLPTRSQLRAKRVLMGVFDDEETPHIAQHHQNMLIHRIDVKQVMLHLADDTPEDPQIPPQYRGLVHQAQSMCDALRRLQNAHEHRTVSRIAAKSRIHQTPSVVKRPERSSRKPFDAHCFLVKQKGLQNRLGVALVDTVIHHIEHARLFSKKSVQRPRRVGGGLLKQPLLHVQVNNLVQLRHRLGCPVVMLHQRFAGTSGVALLTLRRRQPKVLRHRGL